jgi:hypothetical protein
MQDRAGMAAGGHRSICTYSVRYIAASRILTETLKRLDRASALPIRPSIMLAPRSAMLLTPSRPGPN